MTKRVIALALTFTIVGFLAIIVLCCSCLTKVPAGYVGVQYNLRGGVKQDFLTQGMHWVSPTVSVTKYSVSLNQSYLTSDNKGDSPTDESYSACTSEGKDISVDLTFSYRYPPETAVNVFNMFKGQDGETIKNTFIKPNIVSWSKEIIAKYSVTELLGAKRADINFALTDYLSEKFKPYGIDISNVSLINIDVDQETSKVINAKIAAQQNAETQAINNKTAVDKAQADANVKRAQAQAEADALLIKAQAEAEANRLIAESLNDKVLDAKKIEKWDGVMPKYVTGGSNTMIEIPVENFTE